MSAPADPVEEARMPLTEHLKELRTRVVRSCIAFVIAFAVCYTYSEPLFQILQQPLRDVLPANGTLAVTSLAEGFVTHLRVGAIAAFFVASPVFFYQAWLFVAPGLYSHERRLVLPFVIAASMLFVLGACFGYFVVLPYMFSFFIDEMGAGVMPVLSIQDFLGFSAKLLGLFGTIFELPVLSFMLSKLGIVKWQQMVQVRRYAIVAIFVIAAVLTPPDPVSQVLVAIPLVALYEVGIWVARLAAPRAAEGPAKTA